MGRRQLIETLQEDAEERGSPVMHVLEQIETKLREEGLIAYKYVIKYHIDYFIIYLESAVYMRTLLPSQMFSIELIYFVR